MIKVWVLTVVFHSVGGTSHPTVSLSTQQYEYQSQQSCEVWRKQWKVADAHCTQVEHAK